MSGSTCARLSAPTSQMQLLYKLPEKEVRAGVGGAGGSGPRESHTQPELLPHLTEGETEAQRVEAASLWSLSEFREAAGLSGGSFPSETAQVQIPALWLAACLIFGELLSSPVTQFAPP